MNYGVFRCISVFTLTVNCETFSLHQRFMTPSQMNASQPRVLCRGLDRQPVSFIYGYAITWRPPSNVAEIDVNRN